MRWLEQEAYEFKIENENPFMSIQDNKLIYSALVKPEQNINQYTNVSVACAKPNETSEWVGALQLNTVLQDKSDNVIYLEVFEYKRVVWQGFYDMEPDAIFKVVEPMPEDSVAEIPIQVEKNKASLKRLR